MNNGDKQWFGSEFKRLHKRLDSQDTKLDGHSERLAVIETKWSMGWKFVTLISGFVALVITGVFKLLWR